MPALLPYCQIIVYTSAGTDPYYKAANWDVHALLNKFSDGAVNDWSASCLAHLFTHQGSTPFAYHPPPQKTNKQTNTRIHTRTHTHSHTHTHHHVTTTTMITTQHATPMHAGPQGGYASHVTHSPRYPCMHGYAQDT